MAINKRTPHKKHGIEPDKKIFNEPENWTIIAALNRVLILARNSGLSDEFWAQCKSPLEFLSKELGLTNIQIVVLAVLIEIGELVSPKRLTCYLGCSRLSLMMYSNEIEQLVAKRWAFRKVTREFGVQEKGYVIANGVVEALRQNKAFVPEKIDGLNEQQFIDRLESYLSKNMNSSSVLFEDDELWMQQLAQANPQLPLCQEVLHFKDIHTQSLLLMIVFDYAQWADSDGEGLTLDTIDNLYPEDYECDDLRSKLRMGIHELFLEDYIEHGCDDGVVNTERYKLTRKTKSELLSNYVPSKSKCLERPIDNRFLKKSSLIKEKPLFYNDTEQRQIQQLTSLLSQENLPSVQKRLEEQGMRKGFACLFYGAPGTGKTETVLQLARQTGRDIMQIDIAGLRDKFVGESEKNIKEVFIKYRYICRHSEVMPILFFNEADAIINKRVENVEHSVDKMDNAMQNIILQELEDLEGILIATTNLTSNLDPAFERRFLFKVEFHKPDTDVKAQIWQAMLKDISTNDAHLLASHFDFSGGQIENIARKRAVDYVLYGHSASLDEIEDYCRAEMLNGKEHRKIGFAV